MSTAIFCRRHICRNCLLPQMVHTLTLPSGCLLLECYHSQVLLTVSASIWLGQISRPRLQNDLQAMARCHRMGREKEVTNLPPGLQRHC